MFHVYIVGIGKILTLSVFNVAERNGLPGHVEVVVMIPT